MQKSTFKYLGVATLVLASSVLLSACIGGKSPKKEAGSSNAALFVDEVCDGKPYERGVAYDGTKKGIHPTAFVSRDQIDKKFIERGSMVPKAWAAEKNTQTELVVCADSISTTKVKECEIKDWANPNGSPKVLELHDEVYKIRVLEAKTLKELANKEVTIKAQEKCLSTYPFREESRAVYQDRETLRLHMFAATDPFSEVK